MRQHLHRLLGAALALVCLAGLGPLARPAEASYATRVLALIPTQTTATATVTGSAFSTGISQQPAFGTVNGLQAAARVFLSCPTATSGTLDLTVQGSFDKVTWVTLSPLVGGASTAWVEVTTSASTQERNYVGPLPPWMRAVATLASTPSYTFTVTGVIGG